MRDEGDPWAPSSALVMVGEELLLGRTVDTNAAWLAARLAELGIPVVRKVTVGDEEGVIQDALAQGLEHASLVITSGGLGPTSDDLTRPAVAGLLERPLEVDPSLLEALTERYRARGYDELPPANRSQAEVPRGATALANPVGTAPGLVLEDRGRLVALLPGVPRELRALFPALEVEIRRRFGSALRPVHMRTLHTTGIPESVLAPRVEEALTEPRGPVEVAFLPDLEGVDVRLTVRGRGEAEALEALDRAAGLLEPVIRAHRIPGESGDAARALVDRLDSRGWTLGLGESCTGGLLAKRLTDVPGASRILVGGVVAYANRAKESLLNVPGALLEGHGAVSAEVARAMALGAAAAFQADCGIGITGVAGPGGGTREKPVGTVYIAASVGERVEVERLHVPGDREAVRIRSAQAALALLLRMTGGET